HFLAQESSRPADSRLHCALARFQDLRDLVVTAPVDVAKNQWCTILLGKCADGTLNGVASLSIDELEVLQRTSVGRVQFLCFAAIGWLEESGQGHEFAALTFSQLANREVSRNPIDVSRKCVASLVP